MNYRREIDGLRAVAVLPVIFFHAGFKAFKGGFVGVDVFFVISGYLITTIILGDLEKGKFSIVTFYERRARRILPVLFFVMFCCLPFAWYLLLPHHLKEFSQSLTAVALFSSNILFWQESGYFATAAELKPLLHTWSLAVEEQYYIIFPLFLLMLWKLRKRWIVGAILGIAVVSLGCAQWGAYHNASATFFLLPTRAWELMIGALIAFYFLYNRTQTDVVAANRGLCEGLGLLGLALIGYSVFAFDHATPFPSFYALVPTFGTALIIVAANNETMVGRLLGTKAMVGVGLISYSAYLWHQPLFVFARHVGITRKNVPLLFVLCVLTIVLAYLSWRFIEVPFRDKSAFSRKKIFMLAIIGSVFFTTVGLAGHVNHGFMDRFSKDVQPFLNEDENNKYVFENFNKYQQREFEKNSNKVIIIGDSFAGDLVNALVAKGYDKSFAISTYLIEQKCGNLYLKYDFSEKLLPNNRAECRSRGWYENSNLKARMREADTIWLVSYWSDWQAELLKESVANLAAEFGDKVIVFGGKNFGDLQMKKYARAGFKGLQGERLPLKAEHVKTNNLLKSTLPADIFVDVSELLCGDQGTCRVLDQNDKLISFDGWHLTRDGSRFYGERLAQSPVISKFFRN